MAQINVGQYCILVDDSDFELLSKHRWRIQKGALTNYAITTIEGHTIQLTALLLPNEDPDFVVDHIDWNGLNNQRNNIRLITQEQNCQRKRLGSNNKSGYKGVSWSSSRGKWYAYIQWNGLSINLGRFHSKEAAALAYNKAASLYFGEFANLNELPSKVAL